MEHYIASDEDVEKFILEKSWAAEGRPGQMETVISSDDLRYFLQERNLMSFVPEKPDHVLSAYWDQMIRGWRFIAQAICNRI